MSDRPISDQEHNEEESPKQGWHAPESPVKWQKPGKGKPRATWRVPTLPRDLSTETTSSGGWHLPKQEDTTFTTDDVSEVTEEQVTSLVEAQHEPAALSPEDMMRDFEQVETEAAPLPEDIVPDETDYALSEISDLDESDEQQAIDSLEDSLEQLDDEDEESFSMSELVALASLVDEEPHIEVEEGAAAPTVAPIVQQQPATEEKPTVEDKDLTPAERALLQAASAAQSSSQAQSYAEQQLAALQGEQPAAQSDVSAPSDAVTDPEAYARQQLAALGGAGPAPSQPPVSQQPQLDPQVRALAQRYLDTEQQVHTLRQMHAMGQITREDLQERLRNLMVLDENQIYWMLGINSDQWYKFENNQWVPATPPALEALRRYEQSAHPQTGAPRTETGQLPVVDELPEGSLPYMPSSTGVESGTSQMYVGYDEEGGTLRFEDSQPLPRQVPKRDPDMTTVTPAAFRDHISTGSEPTVASQPPVSGYDDYSAPTVATGIPAVGTLGDEPVIEQPYSDEVPDYDAEQAGPIYQQVVEQQRRSMTSILLFALIGLLGCGFLSGAGIVAAGLVWYNGLVSPYEQAIAELGNYQPPPNTVRVLDAEGGLIAELIKGDTGGARTEVDLEEVSPWMIHAVLSTENERFYDDPGWDLFAIVRAFIQNFTSGEIESGASTITQQIARNLVLQSTEATATRKINEIVVANQIAQQYDKNFILSLYLNEFSFGNQSLGVEEAARFYFDKPAAELNLAEAALLAGIIQAPSEFNPVINRERAFERMESIIDRMFEVGCLQFRHGDWPQRGQFCVTPETMVEVPGFDQPQRLAVFNQDGELVGGVLVAWMGEVKARQYLPREVEVKYPHFVNLVRARVEAEFGEETMFSEGFIIHTTLIPRVQNAAENALTRAMQRVITTGVNNGAVMVIDPVSGAIRALVGSADFSNVEIDGQVDNTRAWHQPGSSIKPILYTAALLGGDFNADGNISFNEYLTPVSILWDVPSDYNGYRPVNYDRRFHGPVSLRVALQNSYNVPAVKVMSFIGTQHFVEVAKRMGLQFQDNAQFNLTTALGSTEVRLFDMMRAYATIANGGQNVPLYVIDRITDMDGNAIEWNDRSTPSQAIPPQVAYLMADILTDDNARADAFGTNTVLTLADIGYPTDQYVGAKTGTSDDGRDLWTMGFTKTSVVGVWMGRSDNQPTFNTSGFLTAAPVWHEVMVAAVQGASPQVFQPVSGIVSREVCSTTGTLADENCLNRTFEEVWEQRLPPPPDQGFVKEIAIDTWTQLLSNDFCPEFTQTKVVANIDDPAVINWLNTTAEGQQYARTIGIPLPLEQAPAQACTSGMPRPTARLINPQNGQTLQGTVPITGQVFADGFNRYQLEYAPVEQPDNFTIIGQPSTTPHPNAGDVLAQWDTLTVPNGSYILKLTMFSNSGGFVERTVQVNVQNVLPTATPTPLVTPTFVPPTIDPNAGNTPIPFDDLSPTPTATINPLG